MKRIRSFAIAMATGLLAVDCVAGALQRRTSRSRLHVTAARTGATEQVLIVFPGFAMPAEPLSRSFAPFLSDTEGMVVVEYAGSGIDIVELSEGLNRVLDQLQPRHLRVYGASMGGMCAVDFLGRRTRGEPEADVVLVLDSAPSGPGDLHRARLFSAMAGYPGGPISTVLWWVGCQLFTYGPAEAGADRELVREAQRQFRAAQAPILTSHARYLRDFTVLRAACLDVTRAVFLRGGPPGLDPFVDVDRAIDGWRRAIPELVVARLGERREQWHVPVIERPQETVAAIRQA
jgi:hypothetical protein